MRPLLLDLFCCQGGAAKGYHDAGFDILGVDIEPQPRYPFGFIRADAMEVLEELDASGCWLLPPGQRQHRRCLDLAEIAAAHGSPPCQDWSETRDFGGDHGTGWMLLATRARLAASGLPWVLENVQGSPLARQADLFGANGLELCGCMFPELRGLLYEDRLFETSFPVAQPRHVVHKWPQTKMGRAPKAGECMQVTGHFTDAAEGRRRMGAEWITRDGLAQAVPPAYTRYLGAALLEHISERAA